MRGVSVSFKKRMPTKMLVIGSNVLKIAARCAPMRNVPFWKSMTAPMQIISEKASAASHPARVCGRQSWCEKRQRKNMQTALMSAM